ncbi:hypothetical protein EYF80_022168 [Liparis tanakae]|uniref:Uncharacterized protein n=1 Tax=Liparis tanakae TaxID=230148 RepID=A0A4Z2HP29_9TELE|nr:hypothetical protein EYF80_022168 [Liparis tanakae]
MLIFLIRTFSDTITNGSSCKAKINQAFIVILRVIMERGEESVNKQRRVILLLLGHRGIQGHMDHMLSQGALGRRHRVGADNYAYSIPEIDRKMPPKKEKKDIQSLFTTQKGSASPSPGSAMLDGRVSPEARSGQTAPGPSACLPEDPLSSPTHVDREGGAKTNIANVLLCVRVRPHERTSGGYRRHSLGCRFPSRCHRHPSHFYDDQLDIRFASAQLSLSEAGRSNQTGSKHQLCGPGRTNRSVSISRSLSLNSAFNITVPLTSTKKYTFKVTKAWAMHHWMLITPRKELVPAIKVDPPYLSDKSLGSRWAHEQHGSAQRVPVAVQLLHAHGPEQTETSEHHTVKKTFAQPDNNLSEKHSSGRQYRSINTMIYHHLNSSPPTRRRLVCGQAERGDPAGERWMRRWGMCMALARV